MNWPTPQLLAYFYQIVFPQKVARPNVYKEINHCLLIGKRYQQTQTLPMHPRVRLFIENK